ncbi:uncharacterized protein G2W53_020456 [Senna tora]|uniref:Uncharacterized protein n=1 Tax=Senna tora TaxID=362788 RepID=A0A834TWH4_9FABA|nr:uncharacterized protein G2W53_020456 [Senna tora]
MVMLIFMKATMRHPRKKLDMPTSKSGWICLDKLRDIKENAPKETKHILGKRSLALLQKISKGAWFLESTKKGAAEKAFF